MSVTSQVTAMAGFFNFVHFILILQSIFELTLTRSEAQLSWSMTSILGGLPPPPTSITKSTIMTKSTTQEQKISLMKKDILAKIYRQIQKTANAANKDLGRLSKKFMLNWSQNHRRLSPFFPLVPLELKRITSKMRKNAQTTDMEKKNKNLKSFGRAGLNELALRLVKKRSQ